MISRMNWRASRWLPWMCLLAVLVPCPAWAINHLIVIQEVYSNEDGSLQYVELYTDFSGQTALAPTKVVGISADGSTTTTIYDFTATFSALGAGETILLATADFDDVYGFSPDFVIPDGSVPFEDGGSGRVLFQHTSPCPGITDCEIYAVAYGDFTGDNNRFGDPAPALPLDGCKGLTMTDNTEENSDDYTVDEVGTPEKNSGTSTTLECPPKLPLSMNISEVYSDAAGKVQFVELTAGADDEQLFTPLAIMVANADGTTESTLFDFTDETRVPALAAGDKVLLATEGFSAAVGFSPDFVIDSGVLSLESGRVWIEVDSENCGDLADCEIDAVAYGKFTGTNGGFGTPAEALPADDCHGLTRDTDTADNSIDFSDALGTPKNIEGSTETLECAVTTLDFIRGDTNTDGSMGLGDAIVLLAFMFTSGSVDCKETADVNNNGGFTLSDPLQLLGYLFTQGTAPASPFPDCGQDDNYSLGCDAYDACP